MIIRILGIQGKIGWVTGTILVIICCSACLNQKSDGPDESLSEIPKWEMVRKRAATESLNLIKDSGAVPEIGNMIVLTNAGYAEIGGSSTEAALDGAASVTGASRGSKTLIEIHSAFWDPVWFAVYDRKSGLCAYFQVDSNRDLSNSDPLTLTLGELFSHQAVENIKADHLYAHAADFKSTFESKPYDSSKIVPSPIYRNALR